MPLSSFEKLVSYKMTISGRGVARESGYTNLARMGTLPGKTQGPRMGLLLSLLLLLPSALSFRNAIIPSQPKTKTKTTILRLKQDDEFASIKTKPPRRSGRSPVGRSSSSTPTVSPPRRERAPHQFDHTEADPRPFLREDNLAAILSEQSPNEDATSYIFPNNANDRTGTIISMVPVDEGSHVSYIGLDDLFPSVNNFSSEFCSNGQFRTALRQAIRELIFDSSPEYANMSEKARRMLLLPDSSLQGSWQRKIRRHGASDNVDIIAAREGKLTAILSNYLGENAPTGDKFMETIGQLCGSSATGHWIDIVGIVGRRISHSWHQDTGRCPGGGTRTVLLGFPKEDNYDGVGVFSHVVKLGHERHAPNDHVIGEPIVYPNLNLDDEYVVRPTFKCGREIIMFRDIDVLHSAPDVTFRTSCMRFM